MSTRSKKRATRRRHLQPFLRVGPGESAVVKLHDAGVGPRFAAVQNNSELTLELSGDSRVEEDAVHLYGDRAMLTVVLDEGVPLDIPPEYLT